MTKALLLGALLAVTATSAQAAAVKGARVNADNATLQVDVSYRGCGNKQIQIQISPEWSYTSPKVGNARIIETGRDACDTTVNKTLTFSLRDLGLDRPSLRAASLTIHGEGSSAEVTLPYQL